MIWKSNSGRIQLEMSLEQALQIEYPDPHGVDVAISALMHNPAIARQLIEIKPRVLRWELMTYFHWSPIDLLDHEANLHRLIWIVARDVVNAGGEVH